MFWKMVRLSIMMSSSLSWMISTTSFAQRVCQTFEFVPWDFDGNSAWINGVSVTGPSAASQQACENYVATIQPRTCNDPTSYTKKVAFGVYPSAQLAMAFSKLPKAIADDNSSEIPPKEIECNPPPTRCLVYAQPNPTSIYQLIKLQGQPYSAFDNTKNCITLFGKNDTSIEQELCSRLGNITETTNAYYTVIFGPEAVAQGPSTTPGLFLRSNSFVTCRAEQAPSVSISPSGFGHYLGQNITENQIVVKVRPQTQSPRGKVTCSATGLPEGVTINSDDCKISGTPKNTGPHKVVVTASNKIGSESITFEINVIGRPVIGFPQPAYQFFRNVKISPITLYNTGDQMTFCADNSTLPQGLALTYFGPNCIISGTPTLVTPQGTGVTISSGNPAGTSVATAKFTVIDPPSVRFPAPSIGTVSQPFALESENMLYRLSGCSAKNLPSGLAIAVYHGTKCRISGTPTASFSGTVAVVASNNNQPFRQASGNVDLKITNPPIQLRFLNASGQPTEISKNFTIKVNTQTLIKTGSNAGKIASCKIAPALPNQLVLDPKTCQISGKPNGASNMQYKITPFDADGKAGNSAVLGLTIIN